MSPPLKLEHPHPFTLEQASLLPFATLTAEIARVQNSIVHLQRSQVVLREALEGERDEVLEQAVEENERAISAQEERIMLLHRAIEEKGGAGNGHYDIAVVSFNGGEVARAPEGGGEERGAPGRVEQEGRGVPSEEMGDGEGHREPDGRGVYL